MNFFKHLDKYSHNIAIITEQRQQISYEELLSVSNNIGKQIERRCLVFTVCNNSFESVAGYVGFLRYEGVQVLINSTINHAFFTKLIEAYKPEYIYVPTKITNFNFNSTKVCSLNNYTLHKLTYKKDYAIHQDLALLLTTSGSTGSPKLVRQSYQNINSNAEAIADYLQITGTDRPITTMPMSYSYGLSIINSHLLKGASIVLTNAALMERRFWDEINANDATTFGGVPYVYEMLKKLRFESMDLPSLKYITQAGGKLEHRLSTEIAKICANKGIKFYVMYGQTEATSRMSYLSWEYSFTKTGSIGKAIPGGKFWLEDKNGNIIEENERPGELAYTGDNVTLGYAETCHDLRKNDENHGILLTGDIAKRDRDGFYYIVGRKKRFLKMFGNRVSLDEVEELIRALGHECACAGYDDNLKIYLTNREDQNEILNYIARYTGINQTGLSVIHIDQIPRNSSGKVQYSELKKLS